MKRFLLTLVPILSVMLACAAFAGPPAVSVSVNPDHLTNQNDQATLTFTLSRPATRSIAINLFFSGGASVGSDYALTGPFNKFGQVMIRRGQSSAIVTMQTFEEDIEDGGGTELAAIDVVDGPHYRVGSPSQAVVRIFNQH